MTKDELIKKLTDWKVTNTKAYDILVSGVEDAKVQILNDVVNLRNTLIDECDSLEVNVKTDTDGLKNAILTQKNLSTSSLETLIAAASVPDPVVIPPPPPVVQDKAGILVPAYFYPGGTGLTYWNQVIAAASKVPIFAVANPGNGPGTSVNAQYTDVIKRTIAAGGKILGYVSTVYGTRPLADIQADILKWKSYYGVINIFLDEQSNKLEHVAFYRDLIKWIKTQSPGAYVVTNPGTICPQEYYTQAAPDSILISEMAGNILALPTWAKDAPDKYFTGICYATDVTKALSLASSMRAMGIGLIYVTGDTLSNPWDTLPTYWLQLVDAVAKV